MTHVTCIVPSFSIEFGTICSFTYLQSNVTLCVRGENYHAVLCTTLVHIDTQLRTHVKIS